MDQDYDTEPERLPENAWSKTWEDQYADEFSTDRENLEQQTKLEQDHLTHKIWLTFQNSASSVTHLYKERLQGNNCWFPFQNAASTVTVLYKDALEAQKRNFELGVQSGSNRKVRDIILWAKKKRKHIRRDELIAFLCGKAVPVKPQRHSPTRGRLSSRAHSASPTNLRSPVTYNNTESDIEPDLTAFQNALVLEGLNSGNPVPSVMPSSQSRSDELNCFIMEGLARTNETRKRSNNSNYDVNMDSPTRKKSRFL